MGTRPVTQLKKDVLPAPFGPIKPTISRSFTSTLILFRAATPPKFFETDLTSSRFIVRLLPPGCQLPADQLPSEDPLGTEDHHQNHEKPEKQHPISGETSQQFRQRPQHQRAERRAPDVPHAP